LDVRLGDGISEKLIVTLILGRIYAREDNGLSKYFK
jgi:hypothetical protein